MVKVSVSWKNQSIKDVVIIDDNARILEVMEDILDEQGHRTHPFQSPQKAIEFIKKNHEHIHLVITDQEMPLLSGVQIIEAVREFNYELPIIITSGNEVQMTDLSIEGQINTYFLHKPYRKKALENSINQAVC